VSLRNPFCCFEATGSGELPGDTVRVVEQRAYVEGLGAVEFQQAQFGPA
jgi:hypothetical protein